MSFYDENELSELSELSKLEKLVDEHKRDSKKAIKYKFIDSEDEEIGFKNEFPNSLWSVQSILFDYLNTKSTIKDVNVITRSLITEISFDSNDRLRLKALTFKGSDSGVVGISEVFVDCHMIINRSDFSDNVLFNGNFREIKFNGNNQAEILYREGDKWRIRKGMPLEESILRSIVDFKVLNSKSKNGIVDYSVDPDVGNFVKLNLKFDGSESEEYKVLNYDMDEVTTLLLDLKSKYLSKGHFKSSGFKHF